MSAVDVHAVVTGRTDGPVVLLSNSAPAKLEEIVSAIPDSRLLLGDHAAHLANAEQPGVITPALIAHLEQS